jgi:uncharacterized iron-regulated protein
MVILVVCAILAMSPWWSGSAAADEQCVPVAEWFVPESGAIVPHQSLISELAERGVVLLGESHTEAEHHRWQLQVIAGLFAMNPDIVIGFEGFPRRVQPILNRWVSGEFDEQAFLAEVDWNNTWRVDPDLYMPIFHFARMNRIPMVALNIERSLAARVREQGWDQVPQEDREGVSDPAPATRPYLETLARAYGDHTEDDESDRNSDEELDLEDPAFKQFAEAQLLRDRAMAEAIRDARQRSQKPLVVGIIGGGHLQYRFGVSHQLAALGIEDSVVLLPWEQGDRCNHVESGIADALFGVEVPATPAAPKPRLGVRITGDSGGARVVDVFEGSIAERTGIRKDDVIEQAAGLSLSGIADLIAVVQRQAPGTWLPLRVRRGDQSLDLVAMFPPDG